MERIASPAETSVKNQKWTCVVAWLHKKTEQNIVLAPSLAYSGGVFTFDGMSIQTSHQPKHMTIVAGTRWFCTAALGLSEINKARKLDNFGRYRVLSEAVIVQMQWGLSWKVQHAGSVPLVAHAHCRPP
eukprot:6462012-Amphidinium_carterae.1